MRIAILTIGDELLRGKTVNTNAAFLGVNLQQLGLEPCCGLTVPDTPDAIRQAFDWLLPHNDLIITSGGLGSTGDDLTCATIAAYFGLPLERNDAAAAHIKSVMLRLGHQCQGSEKVMRQAQVPAGSEIFANACGTAPGIWFSVPERKKYICMLPGPPNELHQMVLNHLLPKLAGLGARPLHTRLHYIAHAPELWVEETVLQLLDGDTSVTPAYCASFDHVKLFLSGSNAERLAKIDAATVKAFGNRLLRPGCTSMAADIIELLRERKLTLATAESCTGGLIAAEITAIAGSSDVFEGSAVTYSNRFKHELLGVPEEILTTHGAVSEPCVAAMANNLCDRFKTAAGIAVSGIAGPGGGTPEKPVGLVYIGVKLGSRTVVKSGIFPGNRDSVRHRTTAEALFELRQLLLTE